MKTKTLSRVFLALVVGPVSQASIPHLDAGIPGCLPVVIERPMSDEAATKKLSASCRAMRSAYLKSLDAYSKDRIAFENEVSKIIRDNKSPAPAYRAILMASLLNDRKLLPALNARAKLERSQKLRFQYAVAAIAKIKNGRCGNGFMDEEYDEICRTYDLVAVKTVMLTEQKAMLESQLKKFSKKSKSEVNLNTDPASADANPSGGTQ